MPTPTDVVGIAATQGGTALAPTAPLILMHAQSSDTTAAPFQWLLGGTNFDSQRDSVLYYGYNVADGATAAVSGEPVLSWAIESDYLNHGVHGSEWNFDVQAMDRTRTRPMAFYMDRATAGGGAGMYWWFRIGRSGRSYFQITDPEGANVWFAVGDHAIDILHNQINLQAVSQDPVFIVANANRNLAFSTNNQAFTFYFTPSGQFVPGTDDAMDLGRLAGPLRWRNGYFSGGVSTKIKAGPPLDADFVGPVDGMLAVDSLNNKLWVRLSGTWRGALLTE